MMLSSHPFRSALLACAAVTLALSWASAAEPIRIVFQNGRSVPISDVVLQGDKLTVTVASESFNPGQVFPISSIDHVFGDKPAELNPGIGLLLMGKPSDALKLLEPIVAAQRITAKIPGNFWMDAARAALVAYAVNGNAAKCTEIGKEISDATPAQGIDPFVSLGKALLLPSSTSAEDREVAIRDLTRDDLPADVCAYASFYRGNLLADLKRDPDQVKALQQTTDTLEAYLMVPCAYPAGGMILNSVAELKAAEFLVTLSRREEAIALLESSARASAGTSVAVEAAKRLQSLK